MKRWTLSTTIALTLAMVLASAAIAGNQRPYKASFTATAVNVEQRCGANALTLGFAISGTATHMGRFTATGSHCTEFTLLTEAVDIWDGIIVLTAADGSTVTFSSVGSQDTPAGGTAVAHQTLTVESGTGRFAAADGVLDLTAIIDFTQIANGIVTTAGNVSGWLSY